MLIFSASACHRRVKILETNGIIEKYQAKVNYEKLGIKIEAIVEIKLAQLTENDHNFLSQIKNFDEVINAYIITGESNYVLHVATKDLNSFSHFVINTLNKIKGVVSINSKNYLTENYTKAAVEYLAKIKKLSLKNFTMIETERLILRQWKESDSEPFIKMGLDEDVMRFFPKAFICY